MKRVPRHLAYADKRYPAASILTDIFGGYDTKSQLRRNKVKATHDRRSGARTEVVSRSLCDDVIKYLAPSLEPYKGCTLIDVHPGACVWSSKLHDFLKPKVHILMEPEERYYDGFIKPLLEQPGSTYRHTNLVGAHPRSYWQNYQQILSDGKLMPPRPPLEQDDPKLRQLDTSMLLTGNLARSYSESRGMFTGSVKYVPLVLQHMGQAALANQIIHRSGLTRMLWWFPEVNKSTVLPTSIRGRWSFGLGLDMAAEMHEVVGVQPAEDVVPSAYMASSRVPNMPISISNRVKQDMANSGMQIPPGREMVLGIKAHEDEVKALHQNPLETDCTSVQDLEEAIEAFSKHLKSYIDHIQPAQAKAIHAFLDQLLENGIKYASSRNAFPKEKNNERYISVTRKRAIILADLHLRLFNLEANFSAVSDLHPSDPALPALRERILALDNDLTDTFFRTEVSVSYTVVSTAIDDLRTFYVNPPTLVRDRRRFEPLQAHSHEFWPNNNLTLVDFVPKARDLGLPGISTRREGAKVCSEIIRQLYVSSAKSVASMLDQIAFNASKDLIPKVPAITDVRKGGRLNPAKVPVRTLSPEMVEGLVLAFLEWPFRPESWELELANDAAASAKEGEEAEGEVGNEATEEVQSK